MMTAVALVQNQPSGDRLVLLDTVFFQLSGIYCWTGNNLVCKYILHDIQAITFHGQCSGAITIPIPRCIHSHLSSLSMGRDESDHSSPINFSTVSGLQIRSFDSLDLINPPQHAHIYVLQQWEYRSSQTAASLNSKKEIFCHLAHAVIIHS